MALMVDCHVHSCISFDSNVSKLDMIKHAISQKFNYLCFTDHYDLLSREGFIQVNYNWSEAQKTQKEVNNIFGNQIEIGFGLELGSAYINPSVMKDLKEFNLDFVLGAIHNTTPEFKCVDYSRLDYRNIDVNQLFKLYLDQIYYLIKWGEFDSLAHILYPLRYIKRDKQNIILDDFSEQLISILKLLIGKNIALEINTRDLLLNYSEYEFILKLYRELGDIW